MLSDDDLGKIVAAVEAAAATAVARAVAAAMRDAAMELEAVRVNALMAEVMALRLQVDALERFCEHLVSRLAER